MNKKYKIDRVINDRYAVWYMNFDEGKNKLGVYRIIDLYKGNRDTRFAIRLKARGKDKNKRQEQLDSLAIDNAIRRFGNKQYNRFNRTKPQMNNT